MKHPIIFSRLLLVSMFLLLHSAAGLVSADNGRPAERTYPAFKYSETATEPVIEYNLVHDMIAEPDPQPLLRVYGNGHVHVHYPVYMKKAGDYEMQLSKPELNALIRELSNDGIIDFDGGKALGHRKRLDAEQRAATGMVHNISDDTMTVINIRLKEYRKSNSSKPITNLDKRFTWKNLEQDASMFPKDPEIQRAAAGTDKVRRLMNHSDLKEE